MNKAFREEVGIRRSAALPRLVLATAALGSLFASLFSLRDEMLVDQFQRILDLQSSDPAAQPLMPPPLPESAPVRARLASALYLARRAAVPGPLPERAQLIRFASEDLAPVLDARPHWGEAWIVKAYLESLTHREFSPAERDALQRSYLDAPYLPDAGRWRIQRSLAHWDRLPRSAQTAAANEAVWLIRSSPYAVRRDLLTLARETPAYRSVFYALRENAR